MCQQGARWLFLGSVVGKGLLKVTLKQKAGEVREQAASACSRRRGQSPGGVVILC